MKIWSKRLCICDFVKKRGFLSLIFIKWTHIPLIRFMTSHHTELYAADKLYDILPHWSIRRWYALWQLTTLNYMPLIRFMTKTICRWYASFSCVFFTFQSSCSIIFIIVPLNCPLQQKSSRSVFHAWSDRRISSMSECPLWLFWWIINTYTWIPYGTISCRSRQFDGKTRFFRRIR